MYIDVTVLIGSFLVVVVSIAVIASFFVSRKNSLDTRVPRIAKRECLICMKTFYIAVVTQYWKCPFCGSLNKEYKNDY